jgi:hypothetical protein
MLCVCLQLKAEKEVSYESTVEERQIWAFVYNNGSTVLHSTCYIPIGKQSVEDSEIG